MNLVRVMSKDCTHDNIVKTTQYVKDGKKVIEYFCDDCGINGIEEDFREWKTLAECYPYVRFKVDDLIVPVKMVQKLPSHIDVYDSDGKIITALKIEYIDTMENNNE